MADRAFDVLVIGAGAAGLAAARAVSRAGRPVLVLEARERIGGRVWTRRMPGLAVAPELGAEFIHGKARSTRALLRRAGVESVPSGRRSRVLSGGRLAPADAFAEAQAAMRDTTLLRERDCSFAEFLAKRCLPPRTATLARMMVEGFDAADPAQASARAIAEEWNGGDALLGDQPRPRGGYGPALEWLARELLRAGGRLRLEAPVRELRWRRGRVEAVAGAASRAAAFGARRAIVTLPLGVLARGDVSFRPRLDKREAWRGLASGPVIKAALRFPAPFWEGRYRDTAFFHAPRAAFPTYWTLLPQRAPLLIAWAGGPKAERLAGRSAARLVEAALEGLRALFGRIPDPDQAYVHDWQSDPFARGAYSYVRVGGEGARERLAQPLAGTLFFAGEATNVAGEAGTVSGALQTGERAAREVLRSLD